MKKQKGNINVRREYRQSFISGFEPVVQSRDENGNRKTDVVVESSPPVKRGAGMYQVTLTFIIESVGDYRDEHAYRILLNDDPDISVLPVSKRSKKAIGQAARLPKKGLKGGDSFTMVYGIQPSGQRTLSHTPQHPLQRVAPQIYSYLLGAIDRAIECTILEPEDETSNDDARKRSEGTPTQENVGTDKKKGRRKKVLPEILPETLPEEASGMVEVDGTVLGWGQANSEIRLNQLGGGTYFGGELADTLASGETPDIGF